MARPCDMRGIRERILLDDGQRPVSHRDDI